MASEAQRAVVLVSGGMARSSVSGSRGGYSGSRGSSGSRGGSRSSYGGNSSRGGGRTSYGDYGGGASGNRASNRAGGGNRASTMNEADLARKLQPTVVRTNEFGMKPSRTG